jgi:UDP-N-acetylglucosamine 2-epimerase
MPHEDYLSLLKSVDVMIGNSSSGIIEAPSFNIPVINIGTRQQGRERSNNILDVKAKKDIILKAVEVALHDDAFAKKVRNTTNKFGQGDAAQQIINVLKTIPLDEKLIKKQITY